MIGAERASRQGIVRVCRRLWWRGLIAGPDGNVSVRLADGRLLVTPSGGAKVDVRADALLVVDRAGRCLAGDGRPSSELAMHLAIYAARPDVHAVVHAHPPIATAFALAGQTLPDDVLPELICQMGAVALVPYFTPGTAEAHDAFAPYLAGHHAFLLANHGATTVGTTLDEAHRRMESLEHAARILHAARALGPVTALTGAQRAALHSPAPAGEPPAGPPAPLPGAPPDLGRGVSR